VQVTSARRRAALAVGAVIVLGAAVVLLVLLRRGDRAGPSTSIDAGERPIARPTPIRRPPRLPDAGASTPAAGGFGVPSCDDLARKVRECVEVAPIEARARIERAFPAYERRWREAVAESGEAGDAACRGSEEKLASMWAPLCPGTF
jgi:hypothetical protein